MDNTEPWESDLIINESMDYKNINESWTIDDYYDATFYNETKVALDANNIEFSEFISTVAPYKWYISTSQKPIAIHYNKIESNRVRYLVTKVNANTPSEEYRLYRRNGQKSGDMTHFIENEPLEIARKADYACFFTIKNKAELLNISKYYHGKIYYFGKYFNNRYKVCLATSETIRGVIDPDQIMLTNMGLKKIGQFEAEFNFKALKKQDYLIKFIETPYALDGKYHNVKVQGDRAFKDKYILT